nr:hypothetical protein BaRGS_003653 [Batillaria attramentaria]
MNGYHGTVFAYGQSGSGKTHTMSGSKLEPGIIGLAMQDIFDFIEQKPSHEFLMRASYMEIYNEKIYDLLGNDDTKTLKLQETPDHQISVVGLDETLVNSCEQVFMVIKNGDAKRTVAETKQNDRSSRSHCIFRIIIESRKRGETDAAVMVSHLNFVDLAGSEKAGENSGDRFKEGCAINKSLFCLSQVISKLSEGVGNQFIPYRDSKLTRILQNALGGNSKTAIICTMNPTTIEESHSTLKFATRAKTIKNKPHVNEVLSEAAMLKKYRNEISRLTKLVNEIGVQDIQMANEDLKKQLEDKQELIKQLTQQIVVSSSLTDNPVIQKKKQRRETWCAPKLRRKSHFPSLSSMLDQRKITIREETVLDLATADDLEAFDLPRTAISFSLNNNESRAKAFLRLSEGNEQEESDNKALSVSPTLLGTEQGGPLGGAPDYSETVEKMEYEQRLLMEEVENLKTLLWHAEEQNERLNQKVQHLCDKRYDISLREWEVLEAERHMLQEEKTRLQEKLMQRVKEVEDLQRALAGQEPYITRLEQQLEAQMGAGNGQLGSGSKRRSGIPVPVKQEDSNDSLHSEKASTQKTVEMADVTTSTEDLPQPSESTHVSIRIMVDAETVTETERPGQTEAGPVESSQQEKVTVDAETLTEVPYPDASSNLNQLPGGGDGAQKQTCDADAQTEEAASESFNLSLSQEGNGTIFESTPVKKTPARLEASGRTATPVLEGAEGLAARLRELEQELEQQNKESQQLKEMLNQANSEIVRYKQALQVLENADAERMEEVAQIPKLKALLARRDMEIQRLETRNERLMEEVGHQSFNNSGLSSSFSETPRRSVMLAEREAEVWHLKERMVRQAQSLEDLQHENYRLEDLVIDLRAKLTEQNHSLQVAKARVSVSASLSSVDLEMSVKQEDEEEVETFEQRAVNKVELESLQRKIANQESQITRLEAMLQERDEDIEILFEKNVLVPKDVAEARIKEFEDMKQQLEQLEEQVSSREAEVKKLRMSEAGQKQRGTSHGEDSSFQEQLVLEKMALEETLQEKVQELEDLVTKHKDLELKLDERRNMVNKLKQEQENLTEKLSAAHQELAALKQANSQGSDSDSTVVGKAQEQESLTELAALKQAHSQGSDSDSTVIDRAQEQESLTDLLNVAQEDVAALKDDQGQGLDNQEMITSSTSQAGDEMKEMHEVPDVPVSDNVPQKPDAAAQSTDFSTEQQELVDSLKKREQELLQLLKQKELEINSMREVLKSQARKPSEAHVKETEQQEEEEKDAGERVDVSIKMSLSHEKDVCIKEQYTEDVTSSAATDHSLQVLAEEKVVLELKLQNLTIIAEEKAALEAKVQELSSLIDEKNSVIATLENQLKEKAADRPQTETSESEAPAPAAEEGSADLEVTLAKLAASEEARDSLEKRLSELEGITEEKEAATCKILELEAKLSQLTAAEEAATDLQEKLEEMAAISAEKKNMEEEVQALSSEIETLQTSLKQVQEEREGLAKEIESVKSLLEQTKAEKDKLSEELESQKSDLEHAREAAEEMKAELTWQTQTSDELHAKLEDLEQQKQKIEADAEEQITKLTQESEELIQEIEKTNQLLESSEQCQRVMEETLENHKKNNEALELSNEKLAAERDAFELREEAAQKQNLKLKQRTEQLESRVAVLERQLENAEQSKQLLESVLEENETAQQVDQKLSQELQESQAEVLDLQATLSKLQPALERQEVQVNKLAEAKVQLEEERDQLKETLAKLEAEKEKLLADVMNRMKKAETLEKEVLSLRGVVEEKAALQEKLDKCLKEAVTLKSQMKALQQQVEADSTKMTQLEEERDHMLSEKVRLSVHLKQQEEDTRRELTEEREQLRHALEEVQQRASLAEKESCTLREKALQQSVQIEELKKDLETARAQVSSSVSSQPAPGETVPVIEFKKMKFMLKNKIRDLNAELDKVKESARCKDQYMKELMQKLEAYEDPESPANKEKEIENLTNSLKRKDLELSYIQSQHKKELEALTKQLSNAQEMITYKESSIAKLKGEIRRIRSEEVSFCAPPAPKPQPAAQAAPTQSSSGQAAEERVISSHSGIIDRYTVTLLEADKYKLQKELRKTQDRLKKTEAELHLTKVALSKATGGENFNVVIFSESTNSRGTKLGILID